MTKEPELTDAAYEDAIQSVVLHDGPALLQAFGRAYDPENIQWLFDQIDEHGLGWVQEQARKLGLAVITE